MWVEMEIAPFRRHYISLGHVWALHRLHEEFVSSDELLCKRPGTAQTQAQEVRRNNWNAAVSACAEEFGENLFTVSVRSSGDVRTLNVNPLCALCVWSPFNCCGMNRIISSRRFPLVQPAGEAHANSWFRFRVSKTQSGATARVYCY